jgi:hypothetical protein
MYFSQCDAFDKQFELLEANHLETLSDLCDLLSLVSPATSLLRVLDTISKSKTPVLELYKNVFDFLADAKLTYEFGIVPTVKDANELRNKVVRVQGVMSEIDLLHNERTYHGKFIYELPEGFYPHGTTVITYRSKVRASLDRNSYFTKLLPAHMLGLAPTLGRLWDLVPYSFAVDWLAQISKRLDLVDSGLATLGTTVGYCVHSMRVKHYLDGDYLDQFNIGFRDPADPPALVQYYRVTDNYPLSLSGSKYDFAASTNSPNPWTVGSFAWKMFSKYGLRT